MSELEKRVGKLKNLQQYKDKTEEELIAIVKEQIEKEDILSQLTFCVDEAEKEYASHILEQYLEQRSFEDFAEKETLRQLIDIEILNRRIKEHLKTEYTNSQAIPTNMMDELRKNQEMVIELKEKLNLLGKEEKRQAWAEVQDRLKKKVMKYYETHKGCNTFKCPECQTIIHAIMRLEGYDVVKSVWFKNTLLYNPKVFDLYHTKKITKEEAAQILGVNDKYIDFLYEKIYIKELNDYKS